MSTWTIPGPPEPQPDPDDYVELEAEGWRSSWTARDVIAVLAAIALLGVFVFLVVISALRGGLSRAWDGGLGAFFVLVLGAVVCYVREQKP